MIGACAFLVAGTEEDGREWERDLIGVWFGLWRRSGAAKCF